MSALRRVALGVGLVILASYAWLSIQVYRSTTDPEGFSDAHDGKYSWMIGPSYRDLNRVALERLDRALAVLKDTSLESTKRLDGYRENLGRAETLLRRSLRANPGQPITLAQLAAVRWELGQPLDEGGEAEILKMVEVASAMAPRNPDVQFRLGSLLMKMGRVQNGFAYMAKAVSLDPARGDEVVRYLRDMLVPAQEIASRLPSSPDAVSALLDPYFEDDAGAAFLDYVEPELSKGDWRVLRAYGVASLRLGRAEELRAKLEALPRFADPESEAVRLAQLASADLALGNAAAALEHAKAARAVAPESVEIAQHLGTIASGAGDHEASLRAYRDALGLVARGGGNDTRRAILYFLMGQAEERRGRPDLAYDDYRRAVALDPARADAKARLDAMKSAAGR